MRCSARARMLSSSGLISDCGIWRASGTPRASGSAPKPSGIGCGKLGSGGAELVRVGGADDRDGGNELVPGDRAGTLGTAPGGVDEMMDGVDGAGGAAGGLRDDGTGLSLGVAGLPALAGLLGAGGLARPALGGGALAMPAEPGPESGAIGGRLDG